ncbi:uncharacterized protein TA18660 [Theileria annulata]|uniref:Uncharacterized protein n=1 Tax=Theileria annulata TaxID=5874 RepID=Q4UBF6_THEAN|nr:uncharacterized protein TA18660 [Theileria annulata]CAI75845.1 hypothetical protein TA18660 [Theileria annulata]|eukprot:XP_955321.1 hypothetical protein TA18660 [Theileria annulata]
MDVISCLEWIPRKFCDSDFFEDYIHSNVSHKPLVRINIYHNYYLFLHPPQIHSCNIFITLFTKSDEEDGHSESLAYEDVELDYFDLKNYDDYLSPNEQFFNIRSTDENLLLEDQEDINARKLDESDRVIIAGISNEYFSSLVVYLYDVDTCGLEPNHTIHLSNFPLCSELVALPESPPLLAIGTFEPEISLYNLKLINQLKPTLSLHDNTINDDISVLSLSFSTKYYSIAYNKLVGGYSDNTMRVWDLTHKSIVFTSNHHTKHVQVVLWNPEDDDIVLTGSFDQKASLVDLRCSKPTVSYFYYFISRMTIILEMISNVPFGPPIIHQLYSAYIVNLLLP